MVCWSLTLCSPHLLSCELASPGHQARRAVHPGGDLEPSASGTAWWEVGLTVWGQDLQGGDGSKSTCDKQHHDPQHHQVRRENHDITWYKYTSLIPRPFQPCSMSSSVRAWEPGYSMGFSTVCTGFSGMDLLDLTVWILGERLFIV